MGMNFAKVRLGTSNKCCPVALGEAHLERGDLVVVKTDDGLELGRVMDIFRGVDPQCFAGKLKHLERSATGDDLAQEEKNRQLEKRALQFCQERIQERKLPIHLVRVECLFDASKILFYFTAPGRVDFRELVKDLVQEFRSRIELRQIGVRHRAKMVGGLGICGQGLCCASFLKDFEPVSVRMAKEQQLSLNPSKISGICGRLMCCLTYEYAAYQEIRKHLPRVGKRLKLPEGEAKIIRYNLIRQTATLELEEGGEVEMPLSELPLPRSGGETD
ncbi:MAG: stage 0 sporulation protein [Deltaproteobacteria bacterium RBG_13_58_19]|nr:MAG: stage 0 sporulation protein [Deltaproteobacteria bacterium RBG_13_58_19]